MLDRRIYVKVMKRGELWAKVRSERRLGVLLLGSFTKEEIKCWSVAQETPHS